MNRSKRSSTSIYGRSLRGGGGTGGGIVSGIGRVLRLVHGIDARYGFRALDPCGIGQVAEKTGSGTEAFVDQFTRLLVVLFLKGAAEVQPVDVLYGIAGFERVVQDRFPDVVEMARLFAHVLQDVIRSHFDEVDVLRLESAMNPGVASVALGIIAGPAIMVNRVVQRLRGIGN